MLTVVLACERRKQLTNASASDSSIPLSSPRRGPPMARAMRLSSPMVFRQAVLWPNALSGVVPAGRPGTSRQ